MSLIPLSSPSGSCVLLEQSVVFCLLAITFCLPVEAGGGVHDLQLNTILMEIIHPAEQRDGFLWGSVRGSSPQMERGKVLGAEAGLVLELQISYLQPFRLLFEHLLEGLNCNFLAWGLSCICLLHPNPIKQCKSFGI